MKSEIVANHLHPFKDTSIVMFFEGKWTICMSFGNVWRVWEDIDFTPHWVDLYPERT